MNQPRFIVLLLLLLAAALPRLIPHPPNFSPVAALALFDGASMVSRGSAFLLPLSAMFLSDLAIGWHSLLPLVYVCFMLIVCLGFGLRQRPSAWAVGGAAATSPVLYFILTNFAVWTKSSLYAHNAAGLAACYTVAIPFFWNTLLGDLFYATILFGTLRMAEWRWPVLRPATA